MSTTLLVTADFPPTHGGVGNYYAELFRSFPHDSVVILAEDRPDAKVYDAAFPHTIIRKHFFTPKPTFIPRWFSLLWCIPRLVRAYSIDRICVGQVLPIGHVARWMKRRFGIPYYVFVHGMDIAQTMRPRRRRFIERILHDADGVIANSVFTAGLLRQYTVSKERIFVSTPCPSITPAKLPQSIVERFQEQFAGKRVILFAGRLVKRKGADLAIEALAQLHIGGVHLVVAGDGPERPLLEQLIRTRGLETSVTLLGAISDAELAALYTLCEIFLMPGREIEGDVEGFGMVCLEAATFGKPVIASRTGGVREAVIHRQTGMLVNPGDILEIVSTLRELLNDPALRLKLGIAGRERVERDYTWKNRTQMLRDFFAKRAP